MKNLFSNIRKWEFGKKLLALDYSIFIGLIICQLFIRDVDFTTVICTYIGQLAIATGAYFWKAKHENRIKIPIKIIKSLPKEIRDQLNITEIIVASIQSE